MSDQDRESVMGGRALRGYGIETGRLSASRYEQVSFEVIQSLACAFPGMRAKVVPAYRNKADFGDLDIVVEKEPLLALGGWEAVMQWGERSGHSRAFHVNTPSLSLEWRDGADAPMGFQVDLIMTPSAQFDVALDYYSFNDLGNLVGRIAHKMGLVYGHGGLLYPVRRIDSHQVDTIEVCMDTSTIHRFLGYDHARFREGFDDLVDIFAFAASSAYFNKEIYLLENLNHASRTRDRKRSSYRGFLEWIRTAPGLPEYHFPEQKTDWLPVIEGFFPGFQAKRQAALDRAEEAMRVRAVFNGKRVGEAFGLEGPALGAVMQRVKADLGQEQLRALALSGGFEALRPAIEDAVNALARRPKMP